MSPNQDLEQAAGNSPPELPAGVVRTLSAAAQAAVRAGMPANTRRAYAQSLQRYLEWASGAGWQALPATADSLTEFATWAAYTRGWAVVTIERARWAVLKWHKLNELPVPSTEGLVLVIKGYREHLAGTPEALPRKASPARRDSLTAMLGQLDRTTLVGKRDAFIILVGFAIAGRRDEIASLNIESLTFRPEGMQVSVYRKKTRKQDNPVVHRRSDPAICPVRAAEDLIGAMAACGRRGGPAVVRINQHGVPAHPMTRNGAPIGDPQGRISGESVAEVIRKRALAAGLSGRWTGHSLRRGLATAMHEAGQGRENIERQGGWTPGSTAVAGYIEEAERWMVDVLEGVL